MIGYPQIRENLQRQAESRPNLADLIAYWLALLTLQSRAERRIDHSARLASGATARLQQGKPILLPGEFPTDRVMVSMLSHRICLVTAEHFPARAADLDKVRDWLCREQASLATLAAHFWEEERFRYGEEAGRQTSLLAFVFNQALHPLARKYAKILGTFVNENTWYHPWCPICGGKPDCSALENGARRLICARCDFEWAFWRSACAVCGGDNPDQLAYTSTDQPGYMIQTCAKCGGALPTLALHQFASERLLVVERNLMQLARLFSNAPTTLPPA